MKSQLHVAHSRCVEHEATLCSPLQHTQCLRLDIGGGKTSLLYKGLDSPFQFCFMAMQQQREEMALDTSKDREDSLVTFKNTF